MSSLFPEPDDPTPAPPAAEAYVRVAVERGVDRYPSGLLYGVGVGFDVQPGHRVRVPLGSQSNLVTGTVVERVEADALSTEGVDPSRVRMIAGRADDLPPLPRELIDLASWISSYYVCPIGIVLGSMIPAAVRRGTGMTRQLLVSPRHPRPDPLPRLGTNQRAVLAALDDTAEDEFPILAKTLTDRAGVSGRAVLKRLAELELIELEVTTSVQARARVGSGISDRAVELNVDQDHAVRDIAATLGDGFATHLLFGVTGSGKTEVYLRVVEQVLAKGLTAMVLVPEIALTPQTTARFLTRFADANAAVLHSGLTAAQRHAEWRRAATGEANLVLGARSALFAPIPDGRLGLVVVDEEHDPSFKQDQAPRYHGRDAAIRRAQLAGCPIVLGSATPSLESWHNATIANRYRLHRLPKRAPGLRLPKVTVVDFAEERRRPGPDGVRLIGPRLGHAIARTLGDGGQVMLLLNRRGYANYVGCPDHRCGWTMTCDHCDAGMICHQSSGEIRERWVRCHHCEAQLRLPANCPLCGKRSVVFGLGTQRVEEELRRLHPDLVLENALVRVDSDSLHTGDDFTRVLERFRAGEIRLLAGTQMIAKGLDFPGVRLVGVVNGDTSINLPDFRAAERTFQLVAQVVGRCGRGEASGEAVIQTLHPDAPAIRRAAEHDFEAFAHRELQDRLRFGLPPGRRLARVIVRESEEDTTLRLAEELQRRLLPLVSTEHVELRGPWPCAIARIAGRHRMQIEVLATSGGELAKFLAEARSRGVFTNPLALGERVVIDVDPTSLM